MMQNLLVSQQMREADAHTIASTSISSTELMEAASRAFVEQFRKEVTDKSVQLIIFCGTGNNGGDGLAIARLLSEEGYTHTSVNILRFPGGASSDFNANLIRLRQTDIPLRESALAKDLYNQQADVIIDAILGSGLNRPVEGEVKALIDYINTQEAPVIAVDVPSGFKSEGILHADAPCIRASLVISFQLPKINFFFPESAASVARFSVVPIGLDESFIQSRDSSWKLIELQDITSILKRRKNFSHKGSYGHALIIAGKRETMGAALLCADACLHAGAGLVTACIPESGLIALNSRSPEIMALIREPELTADDFEKYSSIAFGPGTGTDELILALFKKVLSLRNTPMLIDADGLSILSAAPALLEQLPSTSILTPHMKEFDRLFGHHQTWWERIETARQKAAELNVLIILKNQYSFIVLPDGEVLINPTGNPAMAVGGMGDVLTGMIASFLAQGYSATQSAILGCYLHGNAGDELRKEGMNSIPPRYLLARLPYIIGTLSIV